MKRRRFVKHLIESGCYLVREGRRHSVFCNPESNKTSSVPRHSELSDKLADKICKDLGIPLPK